MPVVGVLREAHLYSTPVTLIAHQCY